jgi:hypothetical protein
MKHTVFSTVANIVAVAFLAAATLVHAQDSRHCSNATSAGSWGFTTNGVLLLPTGAVPVVAAGRFTQDISGNLAGSQVTSVGGGVAQETFTGTVTTNADCTAKLRSVSTMIPGISCVRLFSMPFSPTVVRRPTSCSNRSLCLTAQVFLRS